ncbi:hypothetical protein [Aquimarina muelleri]|uniref:Uncharacterized protein n=1 Tax=Aquimarina muelleri TaxID=279356 RepID=A0A918JVY2_9FLAO|nr:hypothetical protein [Aquimarina muelleri]MCX2762462.1 hypothetical protein [Aquimarina muelleri]GGX20676.1 hypothetical protein GCM10007384_22550 [Aquimarina muelleri]
MENKERYFRALIENNGQLNEIDLGEKLGLEENETREIIVQLLSEHKIEYAENRVCNYSLMKTLKRKNNK